MSRRPGSLFLTLPTRGLMGRSFISPALWAINLMLYLVECDQLTETRIQAKMFGKKILPKVADVLVETLLKAGVKRVYGVAGDSLNGITESIRAHDGIEI